MVPNGTSFYPPKNSYNEFIIIKHSYFSIYEFEVKLNLGADVSIIDKCYVHIGGEAQLKVIESLARKIEK